MSPRRQRGEGSVSQRASDGRWLATLDLGWANGKRQRRVQYAKTQRAAVRKLEAMKRELAATGGVASGPMTVETWMTQWLNEIASRRVRPSTLQGYRSKVAQYIVPEIGRRRLDKLEPQHVRALDTAMTKRGLSSATRLQTYAILSRALTVAHREGKVARNVAALIDPPSLQRERTEPLTLEEIALVLKAAEGTPLESRWLAALMLGLRQGEALGLAWEDVDLDAGTLTVRRALQRVKGQGLVMVEPKSKKSNRTLPMPPTLTASLAAHKERSCKSALPAGEGSTAGLAASTSDGPESDQRKECHSASIATSAPSDAALVWANPDGSPFDPRADWQAWKDLLSAAGVRHVRLHDARHVAATVLAAQGVPDVIVSAILGHAQVRVTHGYQHANLDMMTAAMRMIEAAYAPKAIEC